jgi:hypothetical protein
MDYTWQAWSPIYRRERRIEMVKKRRGMKAEEKGADLNAKENAVPEIISKTSSKMAAAESPDATQDLAGSEISIQEKVALLAYRYWEERGCQGGSPEEDWLRAEREILGRIGGSRQ